MSIPNREERTKKAAAIAADDIFVPDAPKQHASHKELPQLVEKPTDRAVARERMAEIRAGRTGVAA